MIDKIRKEFSAMKTRPEGREDGRKPLMSGMSAEG